MRNQSAKNITGFHQYQIKRKVILIIRRDKEYILRDLITALCLCHNVTPVIENGTKIYQASSPDEIALVQLAESLKMLLVRRDQKEIEIETSIGKREAYDILACFPFSSETKRMGIILRMKTTNRIIFYLKGADTIMKIKVIYNFQTNIKNLGTSNT